jgi:hypothetical protein
LAEIFAAAQITKLQAFGHVEHAFPLCLETQHLPFKLDWPQKPQGYWEEI